MVVAVWHPTSRQHCCFGEDDSFLKGQCHVLLGRQMALILEFNTYMQYQAKNNGTTNLVEINNIA